MFWRVAGFTQPSPIEQILDKEEYTLEELLDEDDIIQECKALNGRLVSFLREKDTVEQLLRYLVEPQTDTEDPKKQYKYPFTACEVFCCEVEAIFNTLLQHPPLMQLLFSLLDSPPPLSAKPAGYFGRVVQHLLLRKTNETMSYLQEHKEVLESLIKHIDTTSIADIFKRLMGADEQTSAALLPNHLVWLSETQLIELLLERFGHEYPAEVQQNAADILTSVAHTQPSPIALKLTREQSITHLFQHALAPGGRVLVSALDVCIALLDPRPNTYGMMQSDTGSPTSDAKNSQSKKDAVQATLKYVTQLVSLLEAVDPEATQETPFGMLRPPLGTARLKIVELLSVLMRAGIESAERAVIESGAVPKCLDLFITYPFNNLLHLHVTYMIVSCITSSSQHVIDYLFDTCHFAQWLMNAPQTTKPLPRPGTEESSAQRPPLRAGYMGHITLLSKMFHDKVTTTPGSTFLEDHPEWQVFWEDRLLPQLAVEDTKSWECGRPALGDVHMDHSDGEGDEYQDDMNMEQSMQGMSSTLYHRYNVDVEAEDDDEDVDDVELDDSMGTSGAFGGSGMGPDERAQAIEQAFAGMNILDSAEGAEEEDEEDEEEGLFGQQIQGSRSLPESHVVDMPLEQDDDDQVLYDEELAPAASSETAADPTAAPVSEPESSLPVVAPAGISGNGAGSTETSPRAFPLEQFAEAEPQPGQHGEEAAATAAAAVPMAVAAAAVVAEAGQNGEVVVLEGAGNGTGGEHTSGGAGMKEEQLYLDNMYWKPTYRIEVPDDI